MAYLSICIFFHKIIDHSQLVLKFPFSPKYLLELLQFFFDLLFNKHKIKSIGFMA